MWGGILSVSSHILFIPLSFGELTLAKGVLILVVRNLPRSDLVGLSVKEGQKSLAFQMVTRYF